MNLIQKSSVLIHFVQKFEGNPSPRKHKLPFNILQLWSRPISSELHRPIRIEINYQSDCRVSASSLIKLGNNCHSGSLGQFSETEQDPLVGSSLQLYFRLKFISEITFRNFSSENSSFKCWPFLLFSEVDFSFQLSFSASEFDFRTLTVQV